MQTMRERWTDERLDDLNAKVDRGFDRVEEELRAQRGEITDLRTEMNTRFDGVNARFDALNRTLLTSALGLIVALIASRAIPF